MARDIDVRKLIRMLNSPNLEERKVTLQTLFSLSQERDQTIDQICEAAYGNPEEVQKAIEAETAKGMQAAAILQKKIAMLEQQLQDGHAEGRDGAGLKWFFAQMWDYHQTRLVLLMCIIGMACACPRTFWLVVLGFTAVWMLCKWAERLYRAFGPGQMIIRLLILFAGLYGSLIASGQSPIAGVFALIAVMLLSVSKLVDWLSEHPFTEIIRGCF
jgi:hypothetical protein